MIKILHHIAQIQFQWRSEKRRRLSRRLAFAIKESYCKKRHRILAISLHIVFPQIVSSLEQLPPLKFKQLPWSTPLLLIYSFLYQILVELYIKAKVLCSKTVPCANNSNYLCLQKKGKKKQFPSLNILLYPSL